MVIYPLPYDEPRDPRTEAQKLKEKMERVWESRGCRFPSRKAK